MTLQSDAGELARFVFALFRYADSGSFASLRSFHQFQRGTAAKLIQGIQINGSLDPLIEAATQAATQAANNPWLFAPPICTFLNADRARAEDLANGLTLSVEIDEGDTEAARQRLEFLLGPVTVAVKSGSEWADPHTGQIHPKLHLHWRLSEPTQTHEDHEQLRLAREMACRLADADPTCSPIVHPLRWPGSWNVKGSPRMATIAALNEAAEINLTEAVERLTEAVEAAGMAVADLPRSGTPQAPIHLVADAMRHIPNPAADIHYDQWIRWGYAVYNATGGAGFDIWDEWARKSDKYSAKEQDAAWKRISHAVANSKSSRTVGAGSIFMEAASHGWVRPPPFAILPPNGADPNPMARQNATKAKDQAPDDAHLYQATPFDPALLSTLRPYDWVYGNIMVARYFCALGAPPGTGKSALIVVIALSIATGRPLLGGEKTEPENVWIINLEDPAEATWKLVWACCEFYKIDPNTLKDRLFINSGRDKALVVARLVDGSVLRMPVIPNLTAECKRQKIRALFIDPVVDTHNLPENDNVTMNDYCSIWNQLAEEAGLAVLLSMHFKKGGQAGDPDAFRGASAIIGKARSAITLGVMSDVDAQKLNIQPDVRRYYLRLDNAKRNLAPPPAKADWLRLESVEIPIGDSIQVLRGWAPPSPWEGLPTDKAVTVLEKIDAGPGEGEYFTDSRRGKANTRWVGNAIIQVAGGDRMTIPQASAIIDQWLQSGVLVRGSYHSPSRREMLPCVRVEMAKLTEIRTSMGVPTETPWDS